MLVTKAMGAQISYLRGHKATLFSSYRENLSFAFVVVNSKDVFCTTENQNQKKQKWQGDVVKLSTLAQK